MLERYRVTHWGLIADPDGELVKYAEAQATIADLQGQLKAAKAPRMYDCGSCAIGKGFEQRVAQLEEINRSLMACQCDGCSETLEDNDAYCQKCWTTLQADHARVLGLVQAYAKAKTEFDDNRLKEDHHEWKERFNRLVEAETALIAASLPAQPAQGGA